MTISKVLHAFCFCAIFAASRSLALTPAPWPGSFTQSLVPGSSVYQSPTLIFRGPISTFSDPRDGKSYVTFEGNLSGTDNEYGESANGGNYYSSFVIDAVDKATVAAIYTAASMGSKFTIQYRFDDGTFYNRRVMWIKTFMLETK